MANLSLLIGCRSAAHAVTQAEAMFGHEREPDWEAGPQLGGRYAIPLFWLAAFDASDRLTFERRYPEEDGIPPATIPIYWSPTPAAVARLHARAPMVLAITGEAFADFYAEWIGFVERSYPDALLLQAEDVLDIDGVGQSGPILHAAIEGLASGPLDKALRHTLHRNGTLPFEPGGGKRTAEDAAIHCRSMLAGFDMGDGTDPWPAPPLPVELRAMAARAAKRPWWRFWG